MKVKPAQLTLSNGTDRVLVRPYAASGGDSVFCRSWDLGAPEMRYTSVPNPGADGVTESLGFLGSRTVTLELLIIGGVDPLTGDAHDPYWYLSKLTRMAHPSAFPVLTIERVDESTGGSPWRMSLRGNPYSNVFTRLAGAYLELQLSFTCPLGLIEGVLQVFSTADTPDDDAAVTDWIFPAVFPKGFGLIGASYPQLSIDVGGDTAVTPVIYIQGPVVDPEIRGDDKDVFKFDGLTLGVGEAVQIDMGSGDIRVGRGDTGVIYDDMDAYGSVDWTVSTYWTWAPGKHTLRYRSTKGSVRVEFRERRFTI